MKVLENIQQVLIKRIRIDKVISQKELSEKLGISTMAINKWLNGGSIDIEKIPMICECLNITPNDLFMYNDEESRDILNIVNSDDKLKAYILSLKK